MKRILLSVFVPVLIVTVFVYAVALSIVLQEVALYHDSPGEVRFVRGHKYLMPITAKYQKPSEGGEVYHETTLIGVFGTDDWVSVFAKEGVVTDVFVGDIYYTYHPIVADRELKDHPEILERAEKLLNNARVQYALRTAPK